MKKVLSVAVAALFAAASMQVSAQPKEDVKTKSGGAVVTKDVPPRTIAAGNPARVLRRLDEPRKT